MPLQVDLLFEHGLSWNIQHTTYNDTTRLATGVSVHGCDHLVKAHVPVPRSFGSPVSRLPLSGIDDSSFAVDGPGRSTGLADRQSHRRLAYRPLRLNRIQVGFPQQLVEPLQILFDDRVEANKFGL